MNKVEMLAKANAKICKLKMKGRKYSPEILLILGIAGAVTGTVLACVATTKLHEVEVKKEEELEDMHAKHDSKVEPSEEELKVIKKETTAIYAKTGLRYAGLYAPAVLVSGLSLSCLVFSNVILRKRLISVSAAYATIATSFKEYRNRVAERYGEEAEREIRFNIKQQSIPVTTTDAKGKEKTKNEMVKVMDPNGYSDFARVYDDGCVGWCKDAQANMTFLKFQQAAATQRLKAEGHLFLNTVYEMLGFPKIPEGQVAGWLYDEKNPVGDNYVSFGIFDVTKPGSNDFVNGYSRSIVLDFNIDGRIVDAL